MEGRACPKCKHSSEWLSTTNEWQFYCPRCEIRFNWDGEIMTEENRGRPAVCTCHALREENEELRQQKAEAVYMFNVVIAEKRKLIEMLDLIERRSNP